MSLLENHTQCEGTRNKGCFVPMALSEKLLHEY